MIYPKDASFGEINKIPHLPSAFRGPAPRKTPKNLEKSRISGEKMLAFSEGLVYNSNAVKITIIDFEERRGTDNEKICMRSLWI